MSRQNYKINAEDRDMYSCRSFSFTSKGLTNKGDSMQSLSDVSLTSSSGESSESSSRTSSCSDLVYADGSVLDKECCRVSVVGSHGVGKTALIRQFMTSEYVGDVDDVEEDDDDNIKQVSVMLNGEQLWQCFNEEQTNQNMVPTHDCEIYVVVYARGDRKSFRHAIDILFHLRRVSKITKPIILVENKCDLVRTKVIAAGEGKTVALSYNCKFVETSTLFHHNVDELLVGIHKQNALHNNARTGSGRKMKALLPRIFKSKASCENLMKL